MASKFFLRNKYILLLWKNLFFEQVFSVCSPERQLHLVAAPSRFMFVSFLVFLLTGMASPQSLVGGPAPPFELKTVEDKVIRLSELKGEFVILNFWATWCVPCTKEMPEFQKAHQSLKGHKVKIIGINFGESKKEVTQFIQDYQLSFPVLLDRFGKVAEKYKVNGLPVTYFISPDGIIRDKIFGGGITKEIIKEKISQFN